MRKVIVTGATSMIGLSIIDACLEAGISKVYAVVRPDTKKLGRLPEDSRINVIECSSERYNELPVMIKDECDVFYHAAWSVSDSSRNEDIIGQAKNIQYTLEAVDAAARLKCKKFIGTGSQAEYGKLDIDRINENSCVNPVQPYGIAKYAAGKLAAEEAEKCGMDFFWVRIFSVYGIHDKPTTMVASTIRKLINGEKTTFTAGEQRWDYLYSSDAGRAFYLIGEKAVGNKVYCLGSGQAYPLREYIEIIGKAVNGKAPSGIGEIPYTDGTVMNLCADISRLQKDTGWKPEVAFEDGIRKIIKSLRKK